MKGSVMQTTSNNSILVDFYSATNLGDDLLLHALLKRYTNTQFIMLASREERILEMQYDNLKVIELGTSDCRRLGAVSYTHLSRSPHRYPSLQSFKSGIGKVSASCPGPSSPCSFLVV